MHATGNPLQTIFRTHSLYRLGASGLREQGAMAAGRSPLAWPCAHLCTYKGELGIGLPRPETSLPLSILRHPSPSLPRLHPQVWPSTSHPQVPSAVGPVRDVRDEAPPVRVTGEP